MAKNQDRIPGFGDDAGRERGVVKELADLLKAGLPEKVMPTRYYILEQGRDLLVMKPSRFGQKCELTIPQQRIVKRLMATNGPDAPGNVAVVIWEPNLTTTRIVRWIDHTGDTTREMPTEKFQESIRDWFYRPRGG